eukprot:scaffold4760_cov113-Isochrysis_galbana.AAC.13
MTGSPPGARSRVSDSNRNRTVNVTCGSSSRAMATVTSRGLSRIITPSRTDDAAGSASGAESSIVSSSSAPSRVRRSMPTGRPASASGASGRFGPDHPIQHRVDVAAEQHRQPPAAAAARQAAHLAPQPPQPGHKARGGRHSQ